MPQKRAPLPKAKRELLISVDVGEQRVAIVEDDRVAEVYLERPERRSIAGNIYLGTVDNVLPGMEAAFVEIGLEKNGFLYVDEIVVPELEGKRHGKKITDLIARGQQILVQAVKDPMKTKGARLTTEISLPGRFLVFVPQGEGLGVSRRLDDGERTRLKDIIKKLDVKEGGVIVRTAAEGASAEDVERDLVFLQRLWKTIQARAKTAKAPSLVYQEAELPLRIVRDLFAGDFESAQIDHERTYKRIVGYLKKTSPHMLERVHRYKEKTPLFEGTGVDAEIRSTLNRRVEPEETEVESEAALEPTDTEAEEPEAGAAEPEPEDEDEAEEATEAVAEGAEAAPAKKKTRRGSRGGRNRKKKPAVRRPTDAEPAEAPEAEAAEEASTAATPRIHVPDFELGDEPKPKPARKRTPKPKPGVEETPRAEEGDGEAAEQVVAGGRRGDGRRRGGAARRRRRAAAPAAAATGRSRRAAAQRRSENGAEPAAESVRSRRSEASTNGGEPAADDYVPMSEWLDDLDA